MMVEVFRDPTLRPAAVLEEEVRMRVGQVEYVLIPHNPPFIKLVEDTTPSLFLVIAIEPGQTISRETLETFHREFLSRDDVFQPSFATCIVFYGSSEQNLHVTKEAKEELRGWGMRECHFVGRVPFAKVPPGPYVFAKGKVWQPWRESTTIPTLPSCARSSPRPTSLEDKLDYGEGGFDGRVIVPSRCYFPESLSLPLNGLRVAVKDNIDIKSHRTTLNNRAWREFWPPASKTAHCVQLLIDAGAIIVGKTKSQAMTVREEPLEAVEFTDPFNPRGDGYQVPSGSSSGSAAAIGAYGWLDLSLGSDTNGSVRKPAHYNGCHTIRPTHGIMNTEGVVGFFPEFDMPGFFGRDLAEFPQIMSVWYGESPMLLSPSEKPVNKILYPQDYLPTTNKDQSAVINNFVTALEGYLGVTRESVSIAERWAKDQPDGSDHTDISQYLEKAGCYPFFHDTYQNSEPFRVGYEKAFGKPPFVHLFEHWLWNLGKSISKEERDECWRRLEVYRKWLLKDVFQSTSGVVTIMVLPIEVGQFNYRDTRAPPPYSLLNGYSALNLSPIMKAPEVTAIVGQTKFMSDVTKRLEPYPIAASVLGPPGSDLIVTQLTIAAMKKAGITVHVKTGASVY
ncbi:amidase [Xylariaceae sp. FL0594]|nr:amidase [Xylariaceae sp. FL0594]